MSMFDWYIPDPALACPHCGSALDGWQGHDGPCGLLVWQQGHRHPVDQRLDDEIRWSSEELRRFELPSRFFITSWCCSQEFGIEAVGTANDGVWSETRLVTPEEVEDLHYQEPKASRKARKAWLQKGQF